MVGNCHRLGIVVQGSAIDPRTCDPDWYLEVESKLEDGFDQSEVQPWRINASELLRI